MKRFLSLFLVLAVAATNYGFAPSAACDNLLTECASANRGSMSGFTLVDATYAELDGNGGKMQITMYAGNTYRFLACNDNRVSALVMAIADVDGNLIANNLTEDEQSVYNLMEIKCTATDNYQVLLLPLLRTEGGSGCCGMVYSMQ